MCNVQCAMCNVQCAMCNVQCAMCNVQCAMCNVQCAMCNVQWFGWVLLLCCSLPGIITKSDSKKQGLRVRLTVRSTVSFK